MSQLKTVTRSLSDEYITTTLMFVAAVSGRLLDRAGGKTSDRGPTTLEYVGIAAVIVVAALGAAAIIARKITSKANEIPG